jgi:hypothetical protein
MHRLYKGAEGGKVKIHDVLHFTSLRQMNVERVVKNHWNYLGFTIGKTQTWGQMPIQMIGREPPHGT